MNSKINTLFLLLQAFVCLTYAASFGAQEGTSPCDVFYNEDDTDVTLFCDERNTTLEQIKSALNSLRGEGTIELELYQVNLGTIPATFFKGHNIKILTIAFCELDSLVGGGGRPFQGLEDTLEVLMIKGSLSGGHELENSALSHLRRLREINLEQNSLKEVGNDWFKNAPSSLRTILISDSGISVLGDRVFADVSNLEFLFLNGNKFGPIKRSMFPEPANKLYRLELIDNGQTSIADDFFSNMPNLRMVALAQNSIARLPESIWRPVWSQLSDIDLSENPLECDSHMKWMTSEPTCAKISAKCDSPNEQYGKPPPQIRYKTC